MGFFIITLSFCFIVLLLFLLTIYIYFRLLVAVLEKNDVPQWIYKFGQGFRGRFAIGKLDDITDSTALKEATLFILNFFLANIFLLIIIYYKTHNFPVTLYTCLKAEFAIVIAVIIFTYTSRLILLLLNIKKKPAYRYSSSNAVIGSIFFTSFAFTLCISITGFPEKPIEIQLDKTNVIIGKTKASELLDAGFTFAKKTPESEIINKRNDHFYYGELVEIVRDEKSYGFMSITPTWKDVDKLKNCTITYYKIPADSTVLSTVKFNHKDLAPFTIDDFRTKNLTDIFSLNPVDYKEVKHDTDFLLKLQTADYTLWQRYIIQANFTADASPFYYSVRAQHTIWE